MRLVWNIEGWTRTEPAPASVARMTGLIDEMVDQVAAALRNELNQTGVAFSVRVDRTVETEHGTDR